MIDIPYNVFKALRGYLVFDKSSIIELSQGHKSESSFRTTVGLFVISISMIILFLSNFNNFGYSIVEMKRDAVSEQLSSLVALVIPTSVALFFMKKRTNIHSIINISGCFFLIKMLAAGTVIFAVAWSEPLATDSELFFQGKGSDTVLHSKICGQIQANIDILPPIKRGLESGKILKNCLMKSDSCEDEYKNFLIVTAGYLAENHKGDFNMSKIREDYKKRYFQEEKFSSYFEYIQTANMIWFFVWFLLLSTDQKISIKNFPAKGLMITIITIFSCVIVKNISYAYIIYHMDSFMYSIGSLLANLSNSPNSAPDKIYNQSKIFFDDAIHSAHLEYLSNVKYCPNLNSRGLW